uniref:Uncharacterized protein n=2 Tax=unclassified bacterial viruses TaxID=12333 RepID=A0AAU8KUU8_9VIRU
MIYKFSNFISVSPVKVFPIVNYYLIFAIANLII